MDDKWFEKCDYLLACLYCVSHDMISSGALTLRALGGLGELLQLPAQQLGLVHAPPLSQTQRQVLPLQLLDASPVLLPLLPRS